MVTNLLKCTHTEAPRCKWYFFLTLGGYVSLPSGEEMPCPNCVWYLRDIDFFESVPSIEDN